MEWTIQQIAEKTGLSTDTLRYYDKEGILSPKRSPGGYRLYDEKDLSVLKNIVVMRYAHFSLAEMKNMEALFTRSPGADCNEIARNMLKTKAAGLRQTIQNLQKILALLERLLPMIDSAESYQANEQRIDAFVGQIFEDIRK